MSEKIELIEKIFHGKQSKETKFMNPVVNIDATYVKKGSKRSMEVKLPAFLGNYDRPTDLSFWLNYIGTHDTIR